MSNLTQDYTIHEQITLSKDTLISTRYYIREKPNTPLSVDRPLLVQIYNKDSGELEEKLLLNNALANKFEYDAVIKIYVHNNYEVRYKATEIR